MTTLIIMINRGKVSQTPHRECCCICMTRSDLFYANHNMHAQKEGTKVQIMDLIQFILCGRCYSGEKGPDILKNLIRRTPERLFFKAPIASLTDERHGKGSYLATNIFSVKNSHDIMQCFESAENLWVRWYRCKDDCYDCQNLTNKHINGNRYVVVWKPIPFYLKGVVSKRLVEIFKDHHLHAEVG